MELGDRRSGRVDGDDLAVFGGALDALVCSWSEAVLSTGWMSPADWWHPSVETAAAAVLSGGDPCPALARLGVARAQAGVTVVEAFDDVEALYRAAACPQPPLDAVRSYLEAYGDEVAGQATLGGCEDPLTGLASADYLRTRLAEEYREAARDGVLVNDRVALVVVETPSDTSCALADAMAMIDVADAMRTVFSGGETCVALTSTRTVALVRRRLELPRSVVLLQELLTKRRQGRAVARSWIEGLPRHPSSAANLLAELAA